MRSRSLASKLVLASVSLVALVSLLIAITATLALRNSLMDRLDTDLQKAIERSQRFDGFGPGRGESLSGCGPIETLPPGQNAGSVTAVFGAECSDGVRITEGGEITRLSSADLAELDQVQANAAPQTIDLASAGSYRVAAATNAAGSRIVFGLPTESVDSTISGLIWSETVLILLGLGVATAGAWLIVRRQLRPLREVAATANQVASLPLSEGQVAQTPRVSAELADPETEVGQVAEALNTMLNHVEDALNARHESEQNVRQFLADASHELRTPLTTIRGYAELSRRTGADPKESLAKIESEVERVSALVEDMLLLARLDSGRPLASDSVDLTKLVVEAVADARVVAPQHQWKLELPNEPIVVLGDEIRLHQAVTNLLNNAIRHTPAGTSVTTTLLAGPVRVVVADNGPGISAELLPNLWERFSRGDSSRTRTSGGVGLGTSLVQAIMTAHSGSAEVQSGPDGTSFTLRFAN